MEPTARRDLHLRRTARDTYAVGNDLLGVRGDLLVVDHAATRGLAARMNALRPAGAASVAPGEIVALGLLHEIGHLLVARLAAADDRATMDRALVLLRERLGADADTLLERFADAFPGRGSVPEAPSVVLEELVLTRIANENPAADPLRVLIDDRILAGDPAYGAAIATLEGVAAGDGAPTGEGGSLVDLLRAPARAAPTSLAGQLRYVRDHWSAILGPALASLLHRLELAIGTLVEEERALGLRFGGGPGVGDVQPPSLGGGDDEPEAFSVDSAWMPQLVLMAKSTYVWLDQLSRRYGREIRTLDAIPDEELDRLAGWGVSGLWLIGLWQRSVASERIKRMRGNAEAVASAYSLDDYRIADDLGGEVAHDDLRTRAWARGVRLASDMVPNHMGIDSSWVIDHPEWFLSVPEPPYPAYSFSGADLSADERIGVVLEDHYWDDTDAAVVFKRIDRWSGDERYIYHGNDGTSFPWNDTAQLDFLDPEVREHVIRVILDVARRFPVIRFDAAMVLAKRHIQRLWWPRPGSGDGIPSRAQHAMTQAAFDARIPVEFWREVVDRVAAEVPGTLLLAEAFWMLEGYFVRTLGMHRVYNSAFMHMLRDENGAGYRKLIKDTLAFDPEILKRYVNFMSNPDEATAVEQFGKGDKYFGVATVMATMPGLPMLGHGQVEGFTEKYGMEYRRATLDEGPDDRLVERHEREIFPLLRRRAWFAEADGFLLYDLVTPDGQVDEHVLAYSNGSGPTRSLVIYHDRFASTAGTIRDSAPYARKDAAGSKRLVRRSLAEGLGLPNDPAVFVAFRDARGGLETLHSCRDLWERGLTLSLDAYQGHVFWEFRELHDGTSGQWGRLAQRLAGGGVASLDASLRDLQLEPIHTPLRALLRALFADGHLTGLLDGSLGEADLANVTERLTAFLGAVAVGTGVDGDPDALAAATATRIGANLEVAAAGRGPLDRVALLLWFVVAPIGELAPGADPAATSAAWFDELRMAAVVAGGLRMADLDEHAAWSITDSLRVLLALPRLPSARTGRGGVRGGRARDAALFERWLASHPLRTAMGVNTWEAVEWLDRDRFADLLDWAVRLDAVGTGADPDAAFVQRMTSAAEAAGYRVDDLRRSLAVSGRRPPAPRRPKTG
jgi:glycosidase